MKRPPDTPEFANFTGAMRSILGVSKAELQSRIYAEKKGKRPKPSSPVPVSSSKKARQKVSVSPTLPVNSAQVNRFPRICVTANTKRSESVKGLSLVARLL